MINLLDLRRCGLSAEEFFEVFARVPRSTSCRLLTKDAIYQFAYLKKLPLVPNGAIRRKVRICSSQSGMNLESFSVFINA